MGVLIQLEINNNGRQCGMCSLKSGKRCNGFGKELELEPSGYHARLPECKAAQVKRLPKPTVKGGDDVR